MNFVESCPVCSDRIGSIGAVAQHLYYVHSWNTGEPPVRFLEAPAEAPAVCKHCNSTLPRMHKSPIKDLAHHLSGECVRQPERSPQ